MAYNFVITDVGAREIEVTLPTGQKKAFKGPKSTQEHENWHTDGNYDDFLTIAGIGGAKLNKSYRPGYRGGAEFVVKNLAKPAFFRFLQDAPDPISEAESEAKVKELFDYYLTSDTAISNILEAGAWHIEKTHGLLTYKWNDTLWTKDLKWTPEDLQN